MKVSSIIIIPEAAAKSGGSLKDFVWDRMMEGDRIGYQDNNIILQGIDPNVQATFANLVDIVTAGGSFERIKVGIEIANSSANKLVPEGIPYRSYTDEEGVEQIYTWLEWQNNSGKDRYTDGTTSVFMNWHTNNFLNSEELTIIHQLAYANVLELAAFKQKVIDFTAE